MGDDITIGVTEIVNNIEVTAQPNDQIVDISVTDNADNVTLNITPTVVEVNINKGGSFAKWGDLYGTLSDQTDLQNALNLKANLVGGKVPASELPSYVDDIIEVANYAALPATGEIGKIYVTLDNNKIYRWSGSVYIEIASNSAIWGAITGTLSSQTDLQNALNAKEPTITAGTTSQYWRGDKSWQTLDSSSVGLGNVNNTSDADKPISTATQTALNAKQAALNGTGFVKISGTTISYDNTTYLSGTVAIANGGTGATTAGAARTNLGATTVGANIFTIPNPNPVTKAYIRANADNTVEWLDGNAFRESIGAGTGNGTVTSVNGTGSYGGLTLTGTVTGSGDLTLGGTPTGTWPISITGNASSVNTVQVSTNADFYLTFADANNGSPTSEFLYTIGTVKVNPSTGALTAGSFVKSGGTSSQYLMADGSVSTGSGGTVTSVAAITLGTTGTDLSSTVANGTTTPVITLNVPTASAANRGALSAADWTTFNSKQNALTNPVTGTGTTNYLPKFTGASALGNSAIYDNSGKIGIGTTTTPYKFNVYDTSDGVVGHFSGGVSNYTLISFKSNEANVYSTSLGSYNSGMLFRTGATDRMYIHSNGNVGINTTTDAGYKLDVNGAGRFSGLLQVNGPSATTRSDSDGISVFNGNVDYRIGFDSVNATRGYIRYSVDLSASTHGHIFSAGDWNSTLTDLMLIRGDGNVGIGTTSPNSILTIGSNDATAVLTAGGGNTHLTLKAMGSQGELIFGAGGVSNGVAGTERMRIFSSGNVFIGSSPTDAGYKLDVNGNVRATGFFNSSDNRLKDLIDYDYNVSDIKPITYLWKDGRDNKKHVGYSAQQVQKVMPDAVNEDEKGFLSVNYIEVLVAKISQMEKEIAYLKSKI